MNSIGAKRWLKRWAARTIWAYGPDALLARLHCIGVIPGTTLMFHSSWLPFNGFQGEPADVVRVLKRAVGKNGLLIMPSMPYHNMSSAQWLAQGKPMNVRRSPSMMGLISEVFRRSEGVVRSLSPTHPLLAWGGDANWFIAGHDTCEYPFGADSPFQRLTDRNALILGFDAPFSTFTYTHYVEDTLEEVLPIPLYENSPMKASVTDNNGRTFNTSVKVISSIANKQRREHRLESYLRSKNLLRESKIGNTKLNYINSFQLMYGALELVKSGIHFFDNLN